MYASVAQGNACDKETLLVVIPQDRIYKIESCRIALACYIGDGSI